MRRFCITSRIPISGEKKNLEVHFTNCNFERDIMALNVFLITEEQGYQSWNTVKAHRKLAEVKKSIWYRHPTARRRRANSTLEHECQ